MGKLLKQNYQNYTKDTFLVQTRFQSKAKNAETPDAHSGVKFSRKTRKEVKPILIDDIPTIMSLGTKMGLDTWSQDATGTKAPNKSIRTGTRGALYPDPITRSLPRPPELIDKRAEPKQGIGPTPNRL